MNAGHHLHAFDRIFVVSQSKIRAISAEEAAPELSGSWLRDDGSDAIAKAGTEHDTTGEAAAAAGDSTNGDISAAALHKDALQEATQIAKAEVKKDGGMSTSILASYFRAFGFGWLALYVAVLFSTYGSLIASDLFLSAWTDAAQDGDSNARRWLYLYTAFALGHVLLIVLSSVTFALGCVRASRSLHSHTVHQLLHAPMHWYDATPSGRTMSRFTSDMGAVDQQLSLEMDNLGQLGTNFIVLCGLVMVIARPTMTVLTPVVVFFFSLVLLAVDRSNREIKRLANNAVSPLLTSVREIRVGAALIRAMGFGEFFSSRLAKHVEAWAGLLLQQKLLQVWGQHCATHLTFFIGLGASLSLVATRAHNNAATAALAVTYALLLPCEAFPVSLSSNVNQPFSFSRPDARLLICGSPRFCGLPHHSLHEYAHANGLPREAA